MGTERRGGATERDARAQSEISSEQRGEEWGGERKDYRAAGNGAGGGVDESADVGSEKEKKERDVRKSVIETQTQRCKGSRAKRERRQ